MIEEELVEFDIDEEVIFDTEIISGVLEAFYAKKFYFSYSGIKKLLYYPPGFYDYYILKQKEDRISKNLINGKLIHCLILQPDELNSQFLISPLTVPKGNDLKIVNNIFKTHLNNKPEDNLELKDYEDNILSVLSEINLHQKLKTDQQRIDKILTDENSSYFEFLKIRKDQSIIDNEQLKYCEKSAKIISDNPEMRKFMGLDTGSSSGHTVYNELHLQMDLVNYSFGLHGYLDNLHIDHNEKIIYVNDIKTTAKELSEFEKTIEFFQYYLQAIIYLQLVGYNYKSLIYDSKYSVEFRFITIDKNLQAYAFKVSEETLKLWLIELNNTLRKINYHYIEKKYNLPYEFDRGLITL